MSKISVIFFIVACLLFGCGGKQVDMSLDMPKGHVVDADKNGSINDRDVGILCKANDLFWNTNLLPYMKKAELSDKIDLFRKDANIRLMNSLTVSEWRIFNDNLIEYNKAEADIEATARAIADVVLSMQKPKIRTGKVVSSTYYGHIELVNGVVLKYAGVSYPSGAMSEYSRISALMSVSLVNGRLVRYAVTGNRVGNVDEAMVYVGDLCINEELIKRGYALASDTDIEHYDSFIKIQREAKRLKRGLWAYYPEYNPEGVPQF